MASQDPLARPIGWWLKEADARIEAALDEALSGVDMDRRQWQVLATVATPVAADALAGALRRFDDTATLAAVVANLAERGLVERLVGLLARLVEGLEPAPRLPA